MPPLATSTKRARTRIATKARLNDTNRMQTKEVKRKLHQLRMALEDEIQLTRDTGTARRLQQLVDQVVARLEALEEQDEQTQALEGSIIDFERRQAKGGGVTP